MRWGGGRQKALLGFHFNSGYARHHSVDLVPANVRTMSVDSSHTMFCVHTYLACPVYQAMLWSAVAAGICAGYVFVMRRNKRPKYTKRLWTQRLLFSGVQQELHVDDCSGCRNFVRMTESDFEILLLKKLAPEAKGKIQNFAKQYLPRSD